MAPLQDSNFAQFEREALLLTLCLHGQWSVADVLGYIAQDGAHARALGELTLFELAEVFSSYVQRRRRERAAKKTGADFDALMLEVLREAAPHQVRASYLRTHLGGPRWKLRGSLERLENEGLITREGVTSDTAYCAAS